MEERREVSGCSVNGLQGCHLDIKCTESTVVIMESGGLGIPLVLYTYSKYMAVQYITYNANTSDETRKCQINVSDKPNFIKY